MTMTNRELLAYTGPRELLDGIERQRHFILMTENTPRPCPNCAAPLKGWQHRFANVDDYDLTGATQDKGECPRCHRGIVFTLPLIGDWHWTLVPDAAFHTEPGGVERPEGYYHAALEPAEEAPYCDRCGTYHGHMAICPEDAEEDEDEDEGEDMQACLPGHSHSWVVRDDNEEISYCENCGADGNG